MCFLKCVFVYHYWRPSIGRRSNVLKNVSGIIGDHASDVSDGCVLNMDGCVSPMAGDVDSNANCLCGWFTPASFINTDRVFGGSTGSFNVEKRVEGTSCDT